MQERVPELALSHIQTDDYLEYHHRTFIQRQIEIETETHIGAIEEQKEAEHEQRSQDHEGLVHPLRQCA